jgi:hypothetical protein
MIKKLVENEVLTMHPDNPLPTIGIEIEVPTKHIRSQAMLKCIPLEDLADAQGFPENSNNNCESYDKTLPTYFEYAPYPSYFHDTQGMIISELIRSRQIPRFAPSVIKDLSNDRSGTKLLQKVYDMISPQGIALHVNIGLPDGVDTSCAFVTDYNILAASFPIGFSSQRRLEVEDIGKHLVRLHEDAETTLKTNGRRRLEFRGFEVLDASVYHQLEFIQLIATSMFEAHKPKQQDMILSSFWSTLISDLLDLYPSEMHGQNVVTLGEVLSERENVADVAVRYYHLAAALRARLYQTSQEVKFYLQSRKMYPKN